MNLYPRDDRFLELSKLLVAFSDLTELDVPPFLLLRPENDHHQVYLDGEFVARAGNPTTIIVGATYQLPAPRPLSLAAPGGQYVGTETPDGFGSLVRNTAPAPADEPHSTGLAFRHLTPDQQHRVIRTNLGLPLTTTLLDRHADRASLAIPVAAGDNGACSAGRPRPR
ncbi:MULTISPECIES: hypothetical protein [Achromobacter]|uniref:hypothetical protein n=1 Tax=Achromobacter TaxID=222 RepID=UPI0023F82577|nr:hypothetical protein [Achromobacter anxifer]MDF8363368.1 hypothetical protein [Achromobacter anxifer]